MSNTPQSTLLNQFAHKRYRGTSAIVEPHESAHAFLGPKRGQSHVARISDRVGERFFASDMLAGLQRRDGNLGMQIIWNTDIHQANLRVLDQALPALRRL